MVTHTPTPNPPKPSAARDKHAPHEIASPASDQGAEDESPADAGNSKDKHAPAQSPARGASAKRPEEFGREHAGG